MAFGTDTLTMSGRADNNESDKSGKDDRSGKKADQSGASEKSGKEDKSTKKTDKSGRSDKSAKSGSTKASAKSTNKSKRSLSSSLKRAVHGPLKEEVSVQRLTIRPDEFWCCYPVHVSQNRGGGWVLL